MRHNWFFIFILISTLLLSCGVHGAKNENIEQPKLKAASVIKRIKENFSGILAIQLFQLEQDKVKAKDVIDKKSIKAVQDLSDEALGDLASIFFKEKEGSTRLLFTNSLSPKVNCQQNLLKITQSFLQKVFMNACSASIKSNRKIFDSNNLIKNENQFLYFILSGKKEVRDNIKRNNFDENILAYELKRISTFIDYEITNLFAFVYGHETYHFLTDCRLGKREEFEADGLGALAYQFMNYLINYDLDRLIFDFIPNELKISDLEKNRDRLLIQLIKGREIGEIVFEIYTKTSYEKGSLFHPDLEKRIQEIESLINGTHPDKLYNRYINQQILTKNEDN